MRKRTLFLLLILFVVLIVMHVSRRDKLEQWRPIPRSDIQFIADKVETTTYNGKTGTKTFKVSDYYNVYARIPKKFLRKRKVSNFSIRMEDMSAFLTMRYDDKTGIIFGHVIHRDAPGYIYIGKGKIEGDILKPIFPTEITFNFNPKAECGEFDCPGIKLVFPYTFDELKKVFREK